MVIGTKRLKFQFTLLLAGHLVARGNIALGTLAPEHQNTRTPERLNRFSYTQYHMGIDARLVVYAPDQKTAEDACIAAYARIAELDSIMSDYRRDSELMRLCEKAGRELVPVSKD